MNALAAPFRRAMAAAASLTGRRFGLLVASSVVATSAIVASAMTHPSGPVGPLAALLGRSMASESTPVASTPSPGPYQPTARSSGPSRSPGGGSTASTGGPPAPVPNLSPEAGGPESPEEPSENSTPPAPAPPEAGRVKHVFVISLASPGYEASFGSASQMPYLSETLRPTGDLLSNYSLLTGAALPNGIAAISGQPPSESTEDDCPAFDCIFPVETSTLADQLGIARFTWHAYMEEMVDATGKPHSCVYPGPGETDTPPTGGYAVWQNPFAYFHSLLDLGECALNDVPLTELQASLKKADATPDYSYIAPDLCNAGVPGQCPEGAPDGAAAADAFLGQWVPKIVASPAYKKDGLLIVTFNQLAPAETAAPASSATPRQVGSLLVSPFASPGSTDAAPYGPYSLLRSVEDLFGLTHLGDAGGAKVKSFAPALLGEGGAGD
jgi:hypothetical protein